MSINTPNDELQTVTVIICTQAILPSARKLFVCTSQWAITIMQLYDTQKGPAEPVSQVTLGSWIIRWTHIFACFHHIPRSGFVDNDMKKAARLTCVSAYVSCVLRWYKEGLHSKSATPYFTLFRVRPKTLRYFGKALPKIWVSNQIIIKMKTLKLTRHRLNKFDDVY